MPNRKLKGDAATTAKLLVVLLAFAWGLNWVAAAFALRELTPWSLRVVGSAIGAATLFLAAIVSGHNLRCRAEITSTSWWRDFSTSPDSRFSQVSHS